MSDSMKKDKAFVSSDDSAEKEVVQASDEKVSLPFKKPCPSLSEEDQPANRTSTHYGFLEREARRVSRYPRTYLWVSLITACLISFAGMYWGEFSKNLSFHNIAWPSRGTLIADRQTQIQLVTDSARNLSKADNEEVWLDLINNVQRGWEVRRYDKEKEREQKQKDQPAAKLQPKEDLEEETEAPTVGSSVTHFTPTDLLTLLEQCDVNIYADPRFIAVGRLWPVFKVTDKNASALDPSVLQELCEAEQQTLSVLHKENVCYGCKKKRQCMPPWSLVSFARFQIDNGLGMTCQELAEAWAPLQTEAEQELKQCVKHYKSLHDPQDFVTNMGPCPFLFFPSMVDKDFLHTGRVAYTSSIFVAKRPRGSIEALYKMVDSFGHGGKQVQGAYDTQYMQLMEVYAYDNLFHDVALALGSALITTFAMIVHTRSPYLTLLGILQICLSFPLAYAVYRFVAGITFFPFLNLVGVFVSFGLGADNVFVAVDRWKNERLDDPNASTEEIAAKAIPGAGRAMMLITTTTAIAFFGSSFCPSLPIKLFGIFCGLLIALDYIMDVLVVFPCLCIYDSHRFQQNYWMDLRGKRIPDGKEEADAETNDVGHGNSPEIEKNMNDSIHAPKNEASQVLVEVTPQARNPDDLEDEKTEEVDQVEPSKPTSNGQEGTVSSEPAKIQMTLIRYILLSYYNFLHRWRWFILPLSIAAIGVCCYFATTLKSPPNPADIQLLVDHIEFEQARAWRNELLIYSLSMGTGGVATVMWGVTPADTGDHLNPYEWSQLVLDESFDPSSEEAQTYLLEHSARLFAEDFAQPVNEDTVEAMVRFNKWLQNQSSTPLFEQEKNYTDYCGNATAIPVPQEIFHPCISAWAQEERNPDILVRNGTVKIIKYNFRTVVRFDSVASRLEEEWHKIEDWMKQDSRNAPPEVSKGIFSSFDFWFWDTNRAVYGAAIGSAVFAIGVSGLIILITSKSLSMTLFSAVSVLYVLASVASVMSAADWTLGFLESICFTILIGLSADFVIHFAHAYCELPGEVDRHTRTKYALINLGPSILAAGFTTLVGAAMMLFTIVYFWRLFALVLFFTIVQATIGSFVVFLVLTDTIGPSTPTVAVDYVVSKCSSYWRERNKSKSTEEEAEESHLAATKDFDT